MTHIRPRSGDRAALPCVSPASPLGPAAADRNRHAVLAAMAEKRAEIATLEADWAAASERAAARSLGGIGHLGPRDTWDRTTWNRYLIAASDAQDIYLPRLRRLYAEVDRLEQHGCGEMPHAKKAA